MSSTRGCSTSTGCSPTAARPAARAGGSLLSRTSGYDLHSVRDYQQGESLRRVDWKSTAKRRQADGRELEDSPRDEACVVLDCEAGLDVGSAPDSSFEMQVRSPPRSCTASARRGTAARW